MDEEQIRKIVQDEMQRNYGSGNPMVPPHTHDGSDGLQIDPRDLLGFPIRTVTPTNPASEGTIVLSNIAGTRKLWARINQVWYGVPLT